MRIAVSSIIFGIRERKVFSTKLWLVVPSVTAAGNGDAVVVVAAAAAAVVVVSVIEANGFRLTVVLVVAVVVVVVEMVLDGGTRETAAKGFTDAGTTLFAETANCAKGLEVDDDDELRVLDALAATATSFGRRLILTIRRL